MWKEAQVAHWQIVPINFVRLAQVIADPTAENIFYSLIKKNWKLETHEIVEDC